MIQAVDTTSSEFLQDLVRSDCPLCACRNSSSERMVGGYSLEKCDDCGMVFMNPRPTENHLAEIYTVRDEDELIDLYAKIATPAVLADYREKLAALERLAPQKGRLLDFACAAGYFFEQAQQRGWEAHGCDVGQWTATAAGRRGLKNLHVGDFDELAFPDNHFDVVYAAQVFEHLLDPGDQLEKLKRTLKPGGLLYIDVPNYHTLPILMNRDDFMLNEPPQHINYFTPTTLRQLLTSQDLSSISITSSGGMKWENLLGRPISSDIAAAYVLTDGASADTETAVSFGERFRHHLKGLTKTAVVNPLFYRRLKMGMNLISYSRKK